MASCDFALDDIKSDFVPMKQYYKLITFDKFYGYMKCAICLHGGQEEFDVRRVPLTMHPSVKDIYLPPNDYFACDSMPDEWMDLIPNLNEARYKLDNEILVKKNDSDLSFGEDELSPGKRGSVSSRRQ